MQLYQSVWHIDDKGFCVRSKYCNLVATRGDVAASLRAPGHIIFWASFVGVDGFFSGAMSYISSVALSMIGFCFRVSICVSACLCVYSLIRISRISVTQTSFNLPACLHAWLGKPTDLRVWAAWMPCQYASLCAGWWKQDGRNIVIINQRCRIYCSATKCNN
jgi:hypothetical protein